MTITKTLVSIGNCNFCDKELYEGQKTLYDKEGVATYCDVECVVGHIRKHPREYLDTLFDHDLIEKTTEQE